MLVVIRVNTAQFGEVTVKEEEVYAFPQGLPGFESASRFTFMKQEDFEPFVFMQSLEEEDLVFVVADPFTFHRAYEFDLADEVCEGLELTKPEQIALYVIVTVKEQVEESTVNLLAPIVINIETRKGRQVILHNSPYSTKHPIDKRKMMSLMGGA